MKIVNVTYKNFAFLKSEIEFEHVLKPFKLRVAVGLKSMYIKYENETSLDYFAKTTYWQLRIWISIKTCI